jgi:RNA polymerase sigma factor for flagellar operon FliA
VLLYRPVGWHEGEGLAGELGWVKAAARRMARRTGPAAELDDLMGWGAEGLLEAARSFDPARGVPFAVYARARVRGAMLDGLRAMAPLPLSLHRARADAEGLPEPGDAEAEHCARFAAARNEGLLFETADAADGLPIARAPSDLGPEALAVHHQLRRLVAVAMAELPSEEAELVRLHALEDRPLADAAESVGVGLDRASRLYRRALLRLRSRLREAAL